MKTIITDLDRTLLHTDKSVSDQTSDVLHQCSKRGIKIILATARPQRDLALFRTRIPFDAAVVTNGAIVLLPEQTIVNCIPHSEAQAILNQLSQIQDAVVSIETSDGFFANTDIPIWKPIIWKNFPKLPSDGDLYKILTSCDTAPILPTAQSALTENTYLTVANGDLIQIMSKQATKWNGIRRILEHFGLDAADCVYFGDDYDDIEPIRNCGLGIAVANAIDPVKQAADRIIPDNDSDGVAEYLKTLL